MIAVLLDVAPAGRQRPMPREALAIVGNGLLCRVRAAENWRVGLRAAGVVALSLAVAMATTALGIGVLPPISGHTRTTYGPRGPSPAWLPLAFWGAGLVLALAVAAGGRRGLRSGTAVGVSVLLVAGVVAGSGVAGFLRWYTVPFVWFLLVSLASVGAGRSTRLVAVGAGLAMGAWHLVRYVRFYGDSGWDGEHVRLWTVLNRWSLSFELTALRPAQWWALIVGAVFLAVWRPAAAVAVGLLAVPLALLATGRPGRWGSGLDGQAAIAASATIGLFVAAAVFGWVRRTWTASEGPAEVSTG